MARLTPGDRAVAASLLPVTVLAHAGHWSITLIYLAPFLAVGLWLIRDHMRGDRDSRPRDPGDER